MNLPANAPPCIRSRVPYADYAAIPAISISRLKELRKSPLHYQHALKHPKESAALTLGTAAHTATLEPERFAADYAAWGEKTESGRARPRNGKDWDAFKLEHSGRTIITADEYATAVSIQQAVRNDPIARVYLEGLGDPEVTMQWNDGTFDCKGRADWWAKFDARDVLVGLKTTRDIGERPFKAQAARLGYHMQWAHYADGWKSITGSEPIMIEIVVESAAPHVVVCYEIPAEVLNRGRDEVAELKLVLAECEASGRWPGPGTELKIMSLPAWAYGEDYEMQITDAEEG